MLSAGRVRTGRDADAIDALRSALDLIPENSNGATRAQRLGMIVRDLDRDAATALSKLYDDLGEHAAAVECLLGPIGVLISYEHYEEAAALIGWAEEIVEKHPVEQSQEIAELRRRLESATA